MATTLDVVNDCLGSMGETPLNTLSESHEFKGTTLRLLNRNNRIIQEVGWWCNTESYTAKPASGVAYIQLPSDILKWRSGVKSKDTYVQQRAKPWIVQRGKRLYDTQNRTYEIKDEVVGEIVREIPFEDLPTVLNEYVAAQTVLRFQSNFDADTQKRQELTQIWQQARMLAQAEDIRQAKVNFRDNNPRLAYIKSVTRSARRYVGR